MKTLHRRWLVVATILFGFLAARYASAQKVTLPPETLTASRDLAVATRQLRMGAELGRKVLRGLELAPRDSATPFDEELLQSARNTYALIRAARESMELRKEYMKYPDPVWDLAHKRVTEAWNLARTPIDTDRNVDRARYLQVSTRDLKRALQLVDQALVLLP